MKIWHEKVVVLTGASSGIGRALALQLAGSGARLVLVARRGGLLESLREKIIADGGLPPMVVECDVGDPQQAAALKVRVESEWGAVDVLVNNAGRGAYGPFAEMAPEQLEVVVQTNLLGVIYCTRAFLPRMLERGKGHLVFVSSVLAELPSPEHAVYGATKSAVSGLAENLDYELGPKGIEVTLVEPGLVRSEFAAVSGTPLVRFEQVPSKSPEEVARAIIGAVEAGRSKIVPDALAQLGIKFRRHFPRLARFFFKRAFRRIYGS
jgi:short-subunit dehydrogenase